MSSPGEHALDAQQKAPAIEVVPPKQLTAAEQLQLEKEKKTAWMQVLGDFDWKNIPPHQMAMVLTKKPYKGSGGDPDYYLTPEQALFFAMRCYEMGLSPLSSQVWFNPKTWTTGVTLEGKMELARKRGNVSPPAFKQHKRPWSATADAFKKMTGLPEEPGIECTVTVDGQPSTYVAFFSEWVVPASPVWKAKPMHMLQIRAFDKALAFASGAGVSDMPTENEIEGVAESTEQPNIQVKK